MIWRSSLKIHINKGGFFLIRSLTAEEIESVYRTHMVRDFPPAELKPLRRILAMQADGAYTVLAQIDEDAGVLAYACLCHKTEPRLMDYYAVTENWRGRGVGSAFLKEVLQSSHGDVGIMVELESPQEAQNEDDFNRRQRRVRFYERLGFLPTESRARIFGVHYDIYATHPPEKPVDELLTKIYRYFVPENDVFDREIFVGL